MGRLGSPKLQLRVWHMWLPWPRQPDPLCAAAARARALSLGDGWPARLAVLRIDGHKGCVGHIDALLPDHM